MRRKVFGSWTHLSEKSAKSAALPLFWYCQITMMCVPVRQNVFVLDALLLTDERYIPTGDIRTGLQDSRKLSWTNLG